MSDAVDRDERREANGGASESAAVASPAASTPVDIDAARSKRKFLEKLFAENWNDLTGWLMRRYGPGPPEPEEVAQDSFAKIAGLASVDHIENPRAFLFAIAVNNMLMGNRWLERTRRLIDGELNYLSQDVEGLTPERIYSARERFQTLITQVGDLTEKQREILVRSRLHGQSYAEISAGTGWSAADISRQMTKALRVLRLAIEGAGAPKNED